MVSDSYFAGWASTLMDSDATSVGLFPAGVIFFLVPEGLEGLIGFFGVLLGWLGGSLLFFLLSSCMAGFSAVVCLFEGFSMSSGSGVVLGNDGFMMLDGSLVGVVVGLHGSCLSWVLSVDDVVLSVLGLKGFMDGLWIEVVVIVGKLVRAIVVSISEMAGAIVIVVGSISLTMTIAVAVSVVEWVVVDGLINAVGAKTCPGMVEALTIGGGVAISKVGGVAVSEIGVEAVSKVTVVSVVSKGLDGVSISWSVSVSGLDVMVFTVWLVISIEGGTWSCAVSGVSVVGMANTPIVTSEAVEWDFVVWCLVVMSWPVSLTMVLIVRSSPVWSLLSVRSIKDWLETWVDVAGGSFVCLLKGVRLGHFLSEVGFVSLDFTSVLVNVRVISRVWELVWVDHEWAVATWVNDGGMGSQRAVLCVSNMGSGSSKGVDSSETMVSISVISGKSMINGVISIWRESVVCGTGKAMVWLSVASMLRTKAIVIVD